MTNNELPLNESKTEVVLFRKALDLANVKMQP